jgi:hypothetical protein
MRFFIIFLIVSLRYTKLDGKALQAKLDKVTAELKKYTHVNKKALDQYFNFSEQRKDLIARKKDLDDGRQVCAFRAWAGRWGNLVLGRIGTGRYAAKWFHSTDPLASFVDLP